MAQFTLEEIRSAFTINLEEKDQQAVCDSYRVHTSKEDIVNMFSEITDHIESEATKTPESKFEFEGWTSADRLFFAVREVFIRGVLEGLSVAAKANEETIKDLSAK